MESLGVAALLPLIIEYLKNSRLPIFGWVNHGTVLVTRLLSLAGAAANASGMLVTYADDTLTIVNLTIGTVALFAWEVAKQFGLQEVFYRAAVRPAESGRPA